MDRNPSPKATPSWMKVRLPFAIAPSLPESESLAGESKASNRPLLADKNRATAGIVAQERLTTVCEEAACPNLGHCWGLGTATFMIMGDRCTRRCGFCNIATARPLPLDPDEPKRLARAIQKMGLRHAVITSVDRDDLKDCGSAHFAACITEVRRQNPGLSIEVLIPDFKARIENLEQIRIAKPNVVNHNVETVPSLYKSICPQSNYKNSLMVLETFSAWGFLTKSGIILGLGESLEEVRLVIRDLAKAGVRLLTIGQYLQPSRRHSPLKAYIAPEVFLELKEFALEAGMDYVESGPLVRSSYHAEDSFLALT